MESPVQSVGLYRVRPFLLQGLVLPFCGLYVGVASLWLQEWGPFHEREPAFLAFAGVALVHLLCALSSYWSVHVVCFFTCSKENDPLKAQVAKVVPKEHNGFAELVTLRRTESDQTKEPNVWFNFQKLKYVYDWDKKTFKLIEFPVNDWAERYLKSDGISDTDTESRVTADYGLNRLDMDIPEFMELFKERATAPFFVFQVFCVALWCMDKYWYYSLFTLVMLIIFECTLVHQQLRNMAEIRKMGNKPYQIYVYRYRKWTSVDSDRLLPGDVVSLVRSKDEQLVPCDMVLLRGSCIVDESMLTGESVPQMKEALETEHEKNPRLRFDADADGKLHMLYGGTKIVQHTAPSKTKAPTLRSPENGCVGYVLRTGFNTSQGRLLRTILFGVKRVTANNLETFGFILFLLIFAIAAAVYVWIRGCEDPTRNRYKLFLECTLILTSVVPPELPIELSLAVNTSLLSLSKLHVYCTEPFRIPFAGKIEICCFDKTGTLTSDNLVVEGIAGVGEIKSSEVVSPVDAPLETVQVLATCHSLAQLDDGIVGDPLEKATLTAVEWNLTKGEAVIPKKGKYSALKIFQRFHFSSALKRMSVIAGYQSSDTGAVESYYIGTVKGAPEVLKSMFDEVPESYDDIYLSLTRRGARVLALGHKELGKLSHQEVRDLKREDIETKLKFTGFVIISCPLKADSKKAIAEIINSSHSVVMITGDNPLTACHVAKELKFTRHSSTLILTDIGDQWKWKSIDETLEFPIDSKNSKEIASEYDLCITGQGLIFLRDNNKDILLTMLPYIKVFARFDPKQKEYIILMLKELGFSTLMCGDGTNDVGALKHAEVGVAILSNAPEKLPEKRTKTLKESIKELKEKHKLSDNTDPYTERRNHSALNHRSNRSVANREPPRGRRELQNGVPPPSDVLQAQIQTLLKDMEMQDNQIVKLGDASIAAPFTSRLSSIMCICHIIKQGRCTLVTTLQMFKILALNALILAYCQSVLYLDGIKFSDSQATLQGLLLASCFLFISRSKPLDKLSRQRPLPNIFNVYTIMTVLLQFTVHFCCLIYLVQQATIRMPPREGKVKLALDLADDEEDVFKPDLLNSTVYIISMALQVSTFAINYRGKPFMENLNSNRPLLYSILISGGAVFILAIGLLPELSYHFEIVDFTPEFKIILVQILVADMVFAYLVDRICMWLCGEGKVSVF